MYLKRIYEYNDNDGNTNSNNNTSSNNRGTAVGNLDIRCERGYDSIVSDGVHLEFPKAKSTFLW